MQLKGKPLAAIFVMSILWGYGWTILKVGLIDAPPFKFTALRLGVSALCLLALLPLTGRSLRPTRWCELMVLGFVHTSLLFSLSTWAVAEGSAGRVAFMVYTMPFFTLVFAWLLLNEKVRHAQWGAVILAAFGLIAIVKPWVLTGGFKSSLLAVAAGIVWAIGAVMVKQLQSRERMDLLSMTAWQMAFGCIPLMAISWFASEDPIVWSSRFVLSLGFVSVGVTALGSMLWMYALNNLDAGTASLSTLAAPPIAMVTSAFYFGETPDLFEWLGMSLIVSGLIALSLVNLKLNRKP